MSTPSKGDVGMLGEALAERYLKDQGYRILERNYRKPWGEIDIIAQRGGALHFVEVKAGKVSSFEIDLGAPDFYRPEENVHGKKISRLVRTINSFLAEEKPQCDMWQLDVLVVLFSTVGKKARVRIIPDILAG